MRKTGWTICLIWLGLAGCGAETSPAPGKVEAAPAAAGPVRISPDIAQFYAARGHRPLWLHNGALRPEALLLAERLARQGGIESDLPAAVAAARGGDKRALTRADLLLSRELVDTVRALRRPPAGGKLNYVEEGLSPVVPSPAELLNGVAEAPDLGAHLESLQRTNPLYASLTAGLAAWRARWGALPDIVIPQGPALGPASQGSRVSSLRRRLGVVPGERFDAALSSVLRDYQKTHGLPVSGVADEATVASLNVPRAAREATILANLERARAIPALPGHYVLVDTGSARLWMIDGSRAVGSMRVVAGKPHMPTPAMAGRIRFATLNPYWNLPPDLARDRARRVLREGTGFLSRQRIQALSDWGGSAHVIPLASVDWEDVAAGRRTLRLRQLPGGTNAMGAVKYMFPNDLGIYLHDTPERELLARDDRHFSSGCIRLADAKRLGAWLFRGAPPQPSKAGPEQDVDLPEPVPVYIVYLTVVPAIGGLAFLPDPYGRDPALLAQLRSGPRR